jgi:hypothetical protein
LAIGWLDALFDFAGGTDHRVAAHARGVGHFGLAATSEQRLRCPNNDTALKQRRRFHLVNAA